MQKEYRGRQAADGVVVTVNGRPLNPRHDLYNHSPDGFEWGYSGSGPAQLALAILADHLGNGALALVHHQEFKFRVVAGLPEQEWVLTGDDMSHALQAIFKNDLEGPAVVS